MVGLDFQVALVRHPKAAVAAGICYGRLDLPLHAAAEAQIAAIRAAVCGLAATRIWTSPAQRCRHLADRLGGVTPALDDRLREMDFGAWEGLAWDDVPREALDRWAADVHGFAPPGGESGADVLARVAAFHADLRAAGQPAIVVSHGGPLKLLRAMLRGEPPDLLAPAPPIASVEIITLRS